MPRELKVLTALGTNINLVLQLLDFLTVDRSLDYSAEAGNIRKNFQGCRVAGLHLVCTNIARDPLKELQKIMKIEYPDITLEPLFLGCDDVTCDGEDRMVRERIYRLNEELSGPDLVISSAGRKLITQRLIEAGLLYGCMGYLTITAPFEIEKMADCRRHTENFQIIWTPATELYTRRRQRVVRDNDSEMGDTFRSLYLLPTSLVGKLRQERIGTDPTRETQQLAWLQKLPKTDLHCHLGGAYDNNLLRQLAHTLLDDLEIPDKKRLVIQKRIEKRLGMPLSKLTAADLQTLEPGKLHCLDALNTVYATNRGAKHLTHAVFVASLSLAQLDELAADGREKPPCDLDWYLKCGDLGGSNLLQTENTLRQAVIWLIENAAADGVRYLEVRFSPGNYIRNGLDINRVVDIVCDQARQTVKNLNITVNFLVMATRHKEESEMKAHVDAAIKASVVAVEDSRVVGFDLAGQEEDNPPENFQDIFEPLHQHFINITIHAGEMDSDDKIWQALYRLHAKRIGHGLKLEKAPKMMNYIRDWGISLEMCPSSNLQTNNFRLYDREENGAIYPLKKYLDHGIRVTVNTDNPGISKTTASRELLMAARMTRNGLSKWDILRLLRNGFKAAFLSRDEKDRLLKEVDGVIFALLLEEER